MPMTSYQEKNPIILPEVNEPMAVFLNSDRYLSSFMNLEISDISELDNKRILFYNSLSNLQRLELLLIYNELFFASQINLLKNSESVNDLILD